MDLLQEFLEFLRKEKASKLTVKNYKADISQFIAWLENFTSKKFDPKFIDHVTIDLYKKSKRVKDRSFLRHLSSLRKFFIFLKSKRLITSTPFEKTIAKRQEEEDPFFLNKFKTYLLNSQSSYLTVKNYIIDLKQFFIWAEKVTGVKDAWELKDKNIFDKIDRNLIEEYKIRLTESGFSPLSVNRKLSSLRKYLSWVETENLIRLPKIKVNNLETHNKLLESKILDELRKISRQTRQDITLQDYQQFNNLTIQQSNQYSPIPPLRLAQKISQAFNRALDSLLILPLIKIIEQSKLLLWGLRGKPIFEKVSSIKYQVSSEIPNTKYLIQNTKISNVPKLSYAPLNVSTKYFSWHKKLLHHARYTRPEWYKRYHSYSITHYFHLAILVIFMSAIGFGIYQNFIIDPSRKNPALAASSPPRILSFQGRLTDSSNNPITTSKLVRFQIYDHLTSTGSGHLKWQELDKITPDSDGVFSVLLGNTTASCSPTDVATGACKIPQSLFGDQPDLYLGVTIENNSELSPRQQLATVAYATNAELLQGMPPTTDSSVTGNTNAVLALNSSGTMAIAGTATTTFQATSGKFTLTGKPLRLETNSGTGGNIELFPDGIGKIDLQKPIINTTNNGNFFPGAVEINDTFVIAATNSASAAFIVNNNTTGGNIMSASSSGTTRFVIDNSGNVGVGSTSPLEKLDITGNATISGNLTFSGSTSSISATAMNTLTIGGSTTGNLTLDSGSSSITLSDNTTISGDLTLSGGDMTGANGAVLDIGEANSGDITVTGDMIFADNAFVGLGASAGRITFDDQSTDEIEITGNVGIGNATPLTALDITGSASVSANLSLSGAGTAHTFNILDNGTLNIQRSPGGDAGLATALFIQNDGKVGIGTTDPSSQLTLYSTGGGNDSWAVNSILLKNNAPGNTAETAIVYNNDQTGSNYWFVGLNQGANYSIGYGTGFSSAATKFLINTSGNAGIGTATPNLRLDVQDSQSATGAAQVFNTNTGTDADGLIVKLGNTSTTAVNNANHFISFETSGIGIVGSVRGSGADGVQFQTSGIADFAEYLKKDENEDIQYGSIVCINNEGKVFPCTSQKDTIVGITSKSPTILGGKDLGKGSIAVGLTGQVPLRVSTSNGFIQPGDLITSSEIPGVGVKATKAGQVVGKALEQFNCSAQNQAELDEAQNNAENNTCISEIMVIVNPSWYDPDVYLADTGNLVLSSKYNVSSANNSPSLLSILNTSYIIHDTAGNLIKRVGAYKELVAARLKTGLIETENAVVKNLLVAKNISTQSLSVTTDSVTIAGINFKEYIAEIVNETINNSTIQQFSNGKLISPVAKIDQIQTDIISPLTSNSVKVDSKVVILSKAKDLDSSPSAQNDIRLEVQGSASISGKLTADRLQTTSVDSRQLTVDGEATIAGTLRADRIIANNIEGLEDKIASIASSQKTISDQALSTSEEDHGTNQNPSTSSGQAPQKNAEENFSLVPSDVLFGSALAPDASLSAQLAYIENLSADFAKFNKGLMSFGPTSLADTSIAGQLYIGSQTGGLILADNTINTLGSTLELQPLRQGALSIMAGLVYIDAEGNAVFGKDVTVKGVLAANVISPLPDSDLVIRLHGTKQNPTQNNTEKFVIENASSSGVLSIDERGNLAASGSGRFSDLLTKGLNIVRNAQADTSLTETIATSSAGTATIIAGENQRTIFSPFVTEKSLIYITVTSDTQGVTPYLARQIPEDKEQGIKGSFTIEIPNRVYKDINLNWWIVN